MSLSPENKALIERALPGNTSITNFMDFRCSHVDLGALLDWLRDEAYRNGWNDREADLIAGVDRIMPARSDPKPPVEGGGGEGMEASRSQPSGMGPSDHIGPQSQHFDGGRDV